MDNRIKSKITLPVRSGLKFDVPISVKVPIPPREISFEINWEPGQIDLWLKKANGMKK